MASVLLHMVIEEMIGLVWMFGKHKAKLATLVASFIRSDSGVGRS